jgi:hypothetical protein
MTESVPVGATPLEAAQRTRLMMVTGLQMSKRAFSDKTDEEILNIPSLCNMINMIANVDVLIARLEAAGG